MGDLPNADLLQIYNENSVSTIGPEDVIVLYNFSTGKTVGIKGRDFIAGTDLSSFQWVSTVTYANGEPVLFDGQWWISQQDNNTGNIPTTGAFWQPENKVNAIVVRPWSPGVFENAFSIVTEGSGLYRLRASVVLPFNSQTTPSADLTNWELIAGGGLQTYVLAFQRDLGNGRQIRVDTPVQLSFSPGNGFASFELFAAPNDGNFNYVSYANEAALNSFLASQSAGLQFIVQIVANLDWDDDLKVNKS